MNLFKEYVVIDIIRILSRRLLGLEKPKKISKKRYVLNYGRVFYTLLT